MSARELDPVCPVCAAELSIEQLFANAETRAAFARLAAMSLPLGSKVLAYVGLFAPARNRMSVARKVALIEALLPDLQRGAITRKGRDWAVSHDDWRAAIDQMLAARDARKLSLPLTSHGYLYEVLAGLADKAEASAERAQEQERRGRREAGTREAPAARLDQHLGAALAVHPGRAAPPGPGTSPMVARMKAALAQARPPATDSTAPAPKPTEESPE